MSTQQGIHVQDVTIGYKNQTVVNGISFEAMAKNEKGTLTAIIGANGSGKSTLIKTISGQLTTLAGSISMNGLDSNEVSLAQKATQMSLVLTHQEVSSLLTVQELLLLGGTPYANWLGKSNNETQNRVALVLDQLELTALAHKTMDALSDGQRQRAFIGRALVQDTPIIILDEPTAFLDLDHKARVIKLLRQLAHDGKTILFSTHDIAFALKLCDTIIVLKDGTATVGTPKQLIEDKVITNLFGKEDIVFDGDGFGLKS